MACDRVISEIKLWMMHTFNGRTLFLEIIWLSCCLSSNCMLGWSTDEGRGEEVPRQEMQHTAVPDTAVVPLMTAVGHATYWSTKQGRFMWSLENLQGHGYPVDPTLIADLQLEVPLDFLELMESQQVTPTTVDSITGNGWHLTQAGMLIMWLLSRLEYKAHLQSFSNMVKSDEDEEDDDEGVEGKFTTIQVAGTGKRFKLSLQPAGERIVLDAD